jgi:HK97 family phage prohead protease
LTRDIFQTRSIITELKTRAEADTSKKIIEGYFIVFNKQTELWPGAYEIIDPDSCNNTLSNDIRALINHEHRLVLGRNKIGTLTLRIDTYGVWGEIVINENDVDAMNLYARVQRGDVDQCSFGFNIVREETDWRDDGTVLWTIMEVDLHEVSVVTFPQYEETSAQAGVRERRVEVNEFKAKQLAHRKHMLKERMKKC